MRSITIARRAALAIAVAASVGLVAAPIASASADGTSAKAKKGAVAWGVKESFRGYIEGPIADGGIEVTKPAVRKADGTFVWKKGKGKVDVDADTLTVKSKGTVYFYGHDDGTGPQLEVYVTNVKLVIDGDDSVLIADVSSRGFDGGGLIEYPGVELATVDASGVDLVANGKGKVSVSDLPTALTAEGALAFAGFYSEGTAFDPVSVTLKIKG